MPTVIGGSKISPSGAMTYPGALQSAGWQLLHADIEATAETTNLTRPMASSVNSNVRYVTVPEGAVRCQIRCRYGHGATVTTSPAVRIFGVCGALPSESGTFTEGDLSAYPQRLDSNNNTTGVTIPLDGSNDMRDGTYQWSAVAESQIDSTPFIDLMGSRTVFALTETAASVSGITAVLEIKFLN